MKLTKPKIFGIAVVVAIAGVAAYFMFFAGIETTDNAQIGDTSQSSQLKFQVS